MAKKNRKKGNKPGGFKSTGLPKKKNPQSNTGKDNKPGTFVIKRMVIGLSVIAIVSVAMIAYFTLQNRQIDKPHIKSNITESQDKKSKPESNRIRETANRNTNTEKNISLAASGIQFEKAVHDYGTIKKGSDGTCEFVFKNTGKEPLVLSNVTSSCGCTVPTWPKEPVLPGNSGVIKVVYDTKRVGVINKSITVHSNAANGAVQLNIKGQVVADQ